MDHDAALLVPRQQSRATDHERREEEEFHALVGSIETLLLSAADRPGTAVLAEAIDVLDAGGPTLGEGSLPERSVRP